MNQIDRIQPKITVLNPEQREWIHSRSLQILSTVGVRVDSEPARRLFAKAIGPTVADDDRVRIPPELVEWALRVTPSSIAIYTRNGSPAFRLPGPTRFGVGVTALYYQDPETDRVTPFARRHMTVSVRLADRLSNFDLVSTIGIVQDVPAELSDLYAALEMTANTDKPLVVLVSEETAFPAVLDLLESLHGDLAARPSIIPYFNPITPLVINRGTADKMFTTIKRGLPFIYSNYGMAGASTPITAAGSLVLLNAELLAGLTLSQLIREGTPIILGSLPAFFDMKGMGSFYDAYSYIIDLACAEMMAHYQLPHAGTSGAGMGWGPDLIAAGHQWTNHLLSCMGQVGLVPFVGDNLGSKAFSPVLIVYADEIIGQVRRLAEGFVLNESTVDLQEISDVGPGGNFLTAPLTLTLFREAYYRSRIFPTLTLEEWEAQGCPRADDRLRNHTRRVLDELKPRADYDERIAHGEAFISTLQRA